VTDKETREQRLEEAIQVRQITDYQASWSEEEVGGPGIFTFQLILDNGAEEYVIRPTVGDAKVIRKLLDKSQVLAFDLYNKVLIANDLPLGAG
jgi:hypothetical protein